MWQIAKSFHLETLMFSPKPLSLLYSFARSLELETSADTRV